jgi:hypothetical protein
MSRVLKDVNRAANEVFFSFLLIPEPLFSLERVFLRLLCVEARKEFRFSQFRRFHGSFLRNLRLLIPPFAITISRVVLHQFN